VYLFIKLMFQLNSFEVKLQERGLIDAVNIIVTSDHGMTPISENRVILVCVDCVHFVTRVQVDQYIDLNEVTVVSYGVILFIIPHNENSQAQILAGLQVAQQTLV
jgi:hypothetical protein